MWEEGRINYGTLGKWVSFCKSFRKQASIHAYTVRCNHYNLIFLLFIISSFSLFLSPFLRFSAFLLLPFTLTKPLRFLSLAF